MAIAPIRSILSWSSSASDWSNCLCVVCLCIRISSDAENCIELASQCEVTRSSEDWATNSKRHISKISVCFWERKFRNGRVLEKEEISHVQDFFLPRHRQKSPFARPWTHTLQDLTPFDDLYFTNTTKADPHWRTSYSASVYSVSRQHCVRFDFLSPHEPLVVASSH
jgi:hypothetical protein